MAYGNGCSGCTRVQYWSNPNVTYSGVAMGTTATNNNSRVWNERATTIMAFSQPADNLIVLNSDVSDGAYIDAIAKQSISSNGNVVVESETNVSFRAGNNINLQLGFKAEEGAEFTASIQDISDCGSSTKSGKVLVDQNYNNDEDISVEEINNVSISVFPNPTNDLLNIEYTLINSTTVSIEIVNFLNQKVKVLSSSKIQNAGIYNEEYSVSELLSGTYFLILTIENQKKINKIIIN